VRLPALLFLVACASESPSPEADLGARACVGPFRELVFAGDPDFTREERDAIHAAARAWTLATCRVSVRVSFSDGWWGTAEERDAMRFVRSTNDDPKGFPGSPDSIGITSPKGIWIYADSPCDFAAVALHEIGHAVGMMHVEKRGAAMFPYCDGGSRKITEADMELCRDLATCEP